MRFGIIGELGKFRGIGERRALPARDIAPGHLKCEILVENTPGLGIESWCIGIFELALWYERSCCNITH